MTIHGTDGQTGPDAKLVALAQRMKRHEQAFWETFDQYNDNPANDVRVEDALNVIGGRLVRTMRRLCAIGHQTDVGLRAKLEARSVMLRVNGEPLYVDGDDGSEGDIIAMSILAVMHAKLGVPYEVTGR